MPPGWRAARSIILIKAPPRSPRKLFDKAMSLQQAGRRDEALVQLRTLVAQFPKHLDGNFFLGSLLAEAGQLAEAERYLGTACELGPRSPQAFNNLGNVLRMQGKDAAAIACYQRVTRLDPAFVPAWLNLGLIHSSLKHWQEAIDCFTRIDGDLSNDPDILANLGKAQLGLGATAAAVRCYEKLRQLDPADRHGAAMILAALSREPIPERHSDAHVVETYRRKAASWDADSIREGDTYLGPVHLERLLAKQLGPAGEARLSVLDLGCGTGACGAFLAPRARTLVGVDLSPEMLAVARRKNLYADLQEAEIGAYLSRCEQQFDLIVAAGVLIMFSRLETLFALVAARLAARGMFALTLYRSAEAPIELRGNHHFGHSRDYVDQVIAGAGLTALVIEEVIHETADGADQPGFAMLLQRGPDQPEPCCKAMMPG